MAEGASVRPSLRLGLAIAGLMAAGCAHSPAAPAAAAAPPSLTIAPGAPAPAQSKFYADCIAAASSAGTYEREPGENFLRFNCSGDVAHSFYDGLGAWSAKIGSQVVYEGRTWRFSQKLVKNTIGVDHCSTDGAGDYRCTVILNIGEFLSN